MKKPINMAVISSRLHLSIPNDLLQISSNLSAGGSLHAVIQSDRQLSDSDGKTVTVMVRQ